MKSHAAQGKSHAAESGDRRPMMVNARMSGTTFPAIIEIHDEQLAHGREVTTPGYAPDTRWRDAIPKDDPEPDWHDYRAHSAWMNRYRWMIGTSGKPDIVEVIGLSVSGPAGACATVIEDFIGAHPRAYVLVSMDAATMREFRANWCDLEGLRRHPYEFMCTRRTPVLRQPYDHVGGYLRRKVAPVVFACVSAKRVAGRCRLIASAKFTGRGADMPVRFVEITATAT